MTKKRRILPVLMAVLMLFAMMPICTGSVYAADEEIFNICVYNVTESNYYAGPDSSVRSNAINDNKWIGSGGTSAEVGTQVTVEAKAGPGYVFLGWSTDKTTEGIVSTDAEYSFILEKSVNLYAMFEKAPPCFLTIHWSSIDGVDLMDPVKIEFTSGMTFKEVLEANDLSMDTDFFSKDGYYGGWHRFTHKPFTEYTDYESQLADNIKEDDAFNESSDIYFLMNKYIDAVEFSIKPPVCGSSGETAPEVTVPSGVKYRFIPDHTVWTTKAGTAEQYKGSFTGAEDFFADVILSADYGYFFKPDKDLSADDVRFAGKFSISGGDAAETLNEGYDLSVWVKGVADHSWDAGTITKKATTVAQGEMTYTCTECAAVKTEPIAKLAKKTNPLKIKAKTATVKYSKLKKKNQTLAISSVVKFTKKGQGTMSYVKVSGDKKIKINKKTGKVTIKKGLKKRTYKVRVKVKAAGNTKYKASSWKTVTFKIKVK